MQGPLASLHCNSILIQQVTLQCKLPGPKAEGTPPQCYCMEVSPTEPGIPL